MRRHWLAAGLGMALLTGCTTDPVTGERRISNLGKGAGIGAAVGAGTGVLFGGNDAANAGWGALAGGAVGAAVGAYMDHQERAMRQSLEGTGIDVQRTGQNTLNLTMPSAITFGFDSANLTPQAQSALDSVAQVLTQYPDTTINVIGHTDDIGSERYNQTLSERRARSVGGYLAGHGVSAARIQEQGLGKSQPKVPNTSEANRAENRRVEVAIVANPNAGTPPQPPGGSAPPGQPQPSRYPPPANPGPASPAGTAYPR